MSETAEQVRADPRDMVRVHRVFRHVLAELPALIRAVDPGDPGRSEQLAAHLAFVLNCLDHHHSGEDELLWPLLRQRCADQAPVFARMRAQHQSLETDLARARELLATWRASADTATGRELAESLAAMGSGLGGHLDDEERYVLPLVPGNVSHDEWKRLRTDAMAHNVGRENLIFLGLMFEQVPQDERAEFLAAMPPTRAEDWVEHGRAEFDAYIRELRGD